MGRGPPKLPVRRVFTQARPVAVAAAERDDRPFYCSEASSQQWGLRGRALRCSHFTPGGSRAAAPAPGFWVARSSDISALAAVAVGRGRVAARAPRLARAQRRRVASLTGRRVPCLQYAYAPVRLASDDLLKPNGGYRLTAWTFSILQPLSAAPSMRRPLMPLIHCARRSCVPGQGLTPVCRPHVLEPGDRFHPICANFRSPGPKLARWRASALGKRLPCH
jgi:hypothetical protein